jgi:pimeloyl-ACP methyl ester carboxylesterase
VVVLDMPGFGAAAPLPDGVEPSPANLAAAIRARCLELGLERPHVGGNSLGAWVGLEMGREGWAASVTAISPAGLWRAPLGPRRRDPQTWARRLRPLVSLALRFRRPREAMLSTFAAHPERIPVRAGRELVLGWVDASGYEGANRAMRTHLFDPSGYPEEVPVTIAWGERDRLVGPPKPERRPAAARFLTLPDVGHTPSWDDPKLIARTLLEGSDVYQRRP